MNKLAALPRSLLMASKVFWGYDEPGKIIQHDSCVAIRIGPQASELIFLHFLLAHLCQIIMLSSRVFDFKFLVLKTVRLYLYVRKAVGIYLKRPVPAIPHFLDHALIISLIVLRCPIFLHGKCGIAIARELFIYSKPTSLLLLLVGWSVVS